MPAIWSNYTEINGSMKVRATFSSVPSALPYRIITILVSQHIPNNSYSSPILLYVTLVCPNKLTNLSNSCPSQGKVGTILHENCQFVMLKESPDIISNSDPVNVGLIHSSCNDSTAHTRLSAKSKPIPTSSRSASKVTDPTGTCCCVIRSLYQ